MNLLAVKKLIISVLLAVGSRRMKGIWKSSHYCDLFLSYHVLSHSSLQPLFNACVHVAIPQHWGQQLDSTRGQYLQRFGIEPAGTVEAQATMLSVCFVFAATLTAL